MDVDPAPSTTKASSQQEPFPESEVYLRLLVILYLVDNSALPQALALAHETVEKIQSLNRRSLDPIAAKVYFYLARTHELKGDVAELRPYVSFHMIFLLDITYGMIIVYSWLLNVLRHFEGMMIARYNHL